MEIKEYAEDQTESGFRTQVIWFLWYCVKGLDIIMITKDLDFKNKTKQLLFMRLLLFFFPEEKLQSFFGPIIANECVIFMNVWIHLKPSKTLTSASCWTLNGCE